PPCAHAGVELVSIRSLGRGVRLRHRRGLHTAASRGAATRARGAGGLLACAHRGALPRRRGGGVPARKRPCAGHHADAQRPAVRLTRRTPRPTPPWPRRGRRRAASSNGYAATGAPCSASCSSDSASFESDDFSTVPPYWLRASTALSGVTFSTTTNRAEVPGLSMSRT